MLSACLTYHTMQIVTQASVTGPCATCENTSVQRSAARFIVPQQGIQAEAMHALTHVRL